MDEWKSKNHNKYLLQYHVIFVCKYRKRLLTPRISNDIKRLSLEICEKHGVSVLYKLCHCCGCINEALELNDRDWTCDCCGIHHDRDNNAAINIREAGKTMLGIA